MAGSRRTASEVNAAHRLLMDAVKAGRLGPRSAVMWARRWVAGENIGVVGVLEPGPGRAAANKPLLAHSNQQVLQQLTAVLSGTAPEDEPDPEFAGLFPPVDPTNTVADSLI
jgi:hypothetical protein